VVEEMAEIEEGDGQAGLVHAGHLQRLDRLFTISEFILPAVARPLPCAGAGVAGSASRCATSCKDGDLALYVAGMPRRAVGSP
jgi:hypothetical protein